MNKKLVIYSSLFMLFLPVMFQGPHEELTFQKYLVRCLMPLLMLVVFWINYLWFIPKTLSENSPKKFIAKNIVLVIVTCLILFVWHDVEMVFVHGRDLIPPASKPMEPIGAHFHGRMKMGDRHHDFFFIVLRDVVNMFLSILIAYVIRVRQHVGQLRQKQQELEVAQRDAELRGLRNQISPHFLLNTLNNIYALAAISSERTQNAVMQLSRMLRHMLYDNQDEFVTLTSEARFIESYIELMRLRLSNNVKVETHIDVEEGSTTLIAPLLFISLVENAFKHGVSASDECFIDICLSETPETIHCIIRNSNHPKNTSDRSGHGIGLKNVQSRLDMMYPGKYEWRKGVEGDEYFSEITISKSK